MSKATIVMSCALIVKTTSQVHVGGPASQRPTTSLISSRFSYCPGNDQRSLNGRETPEALNVKTQPLLKHVSALVLTGHRRLQLYAVSLADSPQRHQPVRNRTPDDRKVDATRSWRRNCLLVAMAEWRLKATSKRARHSATDWADAPTFCHLGRLQDGGCQHVFVSRGMSCSFEKTHRLQLKNSGVFFFARGPTHITTTIIDCCDRDVPIANPLQHSRSW